MRKEETSKLKVGDLILKRQSRWERSVVVYEVTSLKYKKTSSYSSTPPVLQDGLGVTAKIVLALWQGKDDFAPIGNARSWQYSPEERTFMGREIECVFTPELRAKMVEERRQELEAERLRKEERLEKQRVLEEDAKNVVSILLRGGFPEDRIPQGIREPNLNSTPRVDVTLLLDMLDAAMAVQPAKEA